jgi:hypothetical protein
LKPLFVSRATVLLLTLLVPAAAMDIDTGTDAIGAAKITESGELGAGSLEPTGWIRLRGADLAKVPATREALGKLRAQGLKTCVMLRWPGKSREQGTQSARHYLPGDLREAYGHGRELGAAYGDLVDAWEVDNEPDLGSVPEAAERYAAFLKANYLGLKAGARDAQTTDDRGQTTEGGGRNTAVSRQPSDVSQQRAPLVLMGALGLPPGPWLERFAANDGFGYTDGFNYHYYGYADDFSGVYEQQKAAVQELTTDYTEHTDRRYSANSVLKKDWPIFLTEIGYGMLGKAARDTKEGRLRQWRWFKSVGEQAGSLRIEAPMAFYLPPYLEYDTLEFGLTVPVAQRTEDGGQRTMTKPNEWVAGGLRYGIEDFRTKSAEPWMKYIGQEIGENEMTPALAWWLGARKPSSLRSQVSGLAEEPRSWTVSVPTPSPVVIDFLPGEGFSPIKRYNGRFVTGLTAGEEPRAKGEAKGLAPETKPPLPPGSLPSALRRHEEFMIHVRTVNGNLYEVYPTRQATAEWQTYSEAQQNFTLSFYGRAELPWRFKDNQPASLVLVLYPKQLPAVYEFHRAQLVQIGKTVNTETTESAEKAVRYGHGKIMLYNFSDKAISGKLMLPAGVERVDPNTLAAISADSASSVLKLLPNERREIPVTVKVPWERFERVEASIAFVPEDHDIPAARLMTAFMPDIGGMKATVVGELLRNLKSEIGDLNRSTIPTRLRATEEAPMVEQGGVFAQQGATVERTNDGFTVTLTGTPPGKQQRVEVEIPWPDGLVFSADSFLTLEYRLKSGGGK